MKSFGLVLLAAVPLVVADTNSTTPGGPMHTTLPPVPLPDTTPVPSTTFTPSANYSSSLSVGTTSSVVSTTSSSSTTSTLVSLTPSQVILTTTAQGLATTMTSIKVVAAPTPTTVSAPNGASATPQLQNDAIRPQDGIQAAALAALVAVCGIMGTL